MGNDILLHPNDVAARYNMTPESLANWRREDKGPPFIKLNGKRVMYRLQDVIEWEFKNRKETK